MWTLFVTVIPTSYRPARPAELSVSTQIIGSITSEKFANQIGMQITKSLEKSPFTVRYVAFQRDEQAQ